MPTIAFDFLETLTRFDNVIKVIWETWKKNGLKNEQHAYFLFNEWYESSCMIYLAKSHSGIYKSLTHILQGTLKRIIYKQLQCIPTDKEIDNIIETYKSHLTPTPTSIEALELAINNGWTVWVITQNDKEYTCNFLKKYGFYTEYDDDVDDDHHYSKKKKGPIYIMTCDELQVAKPHPKVYAQVMRKTINRTQKIENFYYISAQSWDLTGAKNVSMRTAFVKSEELIFTTDIYEGRDPDIQGETVIECVQQILNLESSLKHYYLL